MENTTKRCARCGRELPLDHFHKSAKALDGLQSWRNECKSGYSHDQKVSRSAPRVGLSDYTDAQLVAELNRRKDFNLNDHFTPRDLINALYDLGYRGELTIMIEHTVKLSHE